MVDVCWIAVDGVFVEGRCPSDGLTYDAYAFSVDGEIHDAADKARRLKREQPDTVVTLVFGTVPEGSQ